MRQFLDRIPGLLAAKPAPRAGAPDRTSDVVAKLLEATLHLRVATMRYHSVSSARVKDYEVHPYKLAFALGGLYLLAFVPAYDDVRTFAVDRIRSVSLEKQTFTPQRQVPDDVFGNSLGVNTGPAERVDLRFDGEVAAYVRARVWHASQEIRDLPGGGLALTLHVCHDWALRSWILSWGPFVAVTAPASLAAGIAADLAAARARYGAQT
jgi:predicted DNA-binding transcriptional regulator YafY